MKKYLLGFILLLFSVFAYADEVEIHVTKDSPEFKITQPTNPTTGYAWTIEYDKDLLSLKSEKTYVPNSKLMGAGGKIIWVFTAKSKAFEQKDTQTALRLVYARPWNPKDNPKEMFITVVFS